MLNIKKPFTKNINGRHLTKAKYLELDEYFQTHGEKSEEHLKIQNALENESDFYMMSEYELALLTGQSINSIRANRRTNNYRFHFIKESNNRGKVLYPLKAARDQLSFA